MKPKVLFFSLLGGLGILIVLCLAVYILGRQHLSAKIVQLQKISGDIALTNDQIEQLSALERDYQQIAPLANKAQAVLPSKKQQSEVIAQVSKLATAHSLTLDGLTFAQTAGLPNEKSQTLADKNPEILIMPIDFQSEGSYQQLRGLLQSFERQQRYMRVSTLDIKRSDSNTLDFSMRLEVFLKP